MTLRLLRSKSKVLSEESGTKSAAGSTRIIRVSNRPRVHAFGGFRHKGTHSLSLDVLHRSSSSLFQTRPYHSKVKEGLAGKGISPYEVRWKWVKAEVPGEIIDDQPCKQVSVQVCLSILLGIV